MQTLSNVPFSELRVGDRVKSKVTNREGVITSLINISKAFRFKDNEIFIKWERNTRSHQWYFFYDYVWLM
jgi:hypothetical protein